MAAGMKERGTEGVDVPGLQRLAAQEVKLRREKIALLREELAKHREAARRIEHQLRALGDPAATKIAGKVDWEVLYDQLPPKFSAREVADRAGVGPAHVASVMHRWRREGRIRTTDRGFYQKVHRMRAGR